MTPHEVIKNNIEKFEEKFPVQEHYLEQSVKDMISDYLKSSQLSILLSVKEVVDDELNEDYYNYRNALVNLKLRLDTEINKAKDI